MISYRPFWDTIKEKQITRYALIKYYKISPCTLQRMRDGENLTTLTLDKICRMLHVPIEKVVEVVDK